MKSENNSTAKNELEVDLTTQLELYTAWKKLISSYSLDESFKTAMTAAIEVTKRRAESSENDITYKESVNVVEYALDGCTIDGEQTLKQCLRRQCIVTTRALSRVKTAGEIEHFREKLSLLCVIRYFLESLCYRAA